MELLKTDNNSEMEHKSNKETISSIIDEIFMICKNDKKFINYDEVKLIDIKLNDLKEKNKKQDHFISESKKIEKDLDDKINDCNLFITSSKSKLLESFGSDI